MKKIPKNLKRPQSVEKAIRITWASLESHLPYTHEKSPEGQAFHRKCVQEYVNLLVELSKLY